jgi:hypothetical protein
VRGEKQAVNGSGEFAEVPHSSEALITARVHDMQTSQSFLPLTSHLSPPEEPLG